MQIPVDNDSGHPQFSTGFPHGLFARRRLLQAINERGSLMPAISKCTSAGRCIRSPIISRIRGGYSTPLSPGSMSGVGGRAEVNFGPRKVCF
jgi:hypothetical protein